MKNLFTVVLSTLFTITVIAQTDSEISSSNGLDIPERTPVLTTLYQEAENLYETGTAAQINANRLAIKKEWATIDPAVADLYTPINAPTYGRLGEGPIPYVPTQIIERPEPLPLSRDWGDDILLRNDFVDGVDIEVTGNTGDIYVGMYDNAIDAGGSTDNVYIYRSQDNGTTWDLFAEEMTVAAVRKIQLISIDGTGDNYILAYLMFDNGLFQVARWDTITQDLEVDTIRGSGVTDFSVDRSFQDATASLVVLASYLVDNGGGCESVNSARSTAGSFGFDWVDEVSPGHCGEEIDFTYARAGDSFMVYRENGTGNLLARSNDALNDPTSWSGFDMVATGAISETINPTIRAARLPIGNEKVLIWTSHRLVGAGYEFNTAGYLRENGGSFSLFSVAVSDGTNWNNAHTDGWVRREIGNDILRMSYVSDNIDNSVNDFNRSVRFNGVGFDTIEEVSNTTLDVFDGFPSAVAETSDNEPCLVFAGTSGGRGFGLYFDTRADILETVDQEIEGLSYYPNPTNDSMTISAENEISSITIYTMLGQPLLELKPNAKKVVLQTSTLTSGIFFMNVTAGRQMERFKIMKN